MKPFVSFLLAFGCLPRAVAIFGVGDIVHDPINSSILIETKFETLAKWAEAIKRAEDQVGNQVKQINEAKRLFDVQNQIRATIGDWQGVVDRAKSLQLSADNLTRDYTERVRNSFVVDYGQANLAPRNAFGEIVTIRPEEISAYRNLEDVTRNAADVLTGSAAESKAIGREIAEAYQEMTKAGVTQQEYEKLRGKIQTLTGRQQALQAQRQDALAVMQAQQTVNRNQAAKEEALKAKVRDSNHAALAAGISKVQFDALSWR